MTDPQHASKRRCSSITTTTRFRDHSHAESEIKVLVIEDSAAQALIIQQMLRPTAITTFHLQTVDHISAGIQQLEQEPFDVVLLDLVLPDSVGLDPLLRVYARYPEVPIIVLTGIDDEQLVAKALQTGAQDYLIKGNLNHDMLIRSIQYAIERNRRQQAERTVLRTQLEERRRLARELHDGVIQSLSVIRLRLQMLDDELVRKGDGQTAGAIRELAEEALTAIHDVRLVSYDLHPSELDKRELAEAIESYGRQLERQYGLAFEITDRCDPSLSDHVKNHLYRIVQESMRNCAKHAAATRLRVAMQDQAFLLTIEVHDDGIGFKESQSISSTSSLGLVSMRERARLLGGTVEIQSEPGTGTTVLIQIPF